MMDPELYRRFGESRLDDFRREARSARLISQFREERRTGAARDRLPAPRWRRAFGGVLLAAGTRLAGQ